ncbi:MAG TPA: glycoside hydrolase family 78 protein [Candidatus Borkfalkia excrementigallinarum]|uniref:alpha-L-rhamnosidase n=1 Tax=Candidatus Borkfalkia excrementigallinarum TaxID=2838506 RepID=A0A9D1ZWS9_9FIRM|nr:glycoside hydrolase family 78 protein [Candidatus Borkfalkia excrementigallinarum]
MFEIDEIKIENRNCGCVTDSDAPRIAFSLKSDRQGTELASAIVRVGGKEFTTKEQCGVALKELALRPFTRYEVSVTATDNFGNRAEGKSFFCTGRRELPWTAKWINNASYTFPKNASPAPFTFRKIFAAKKIKRALLTATALGIYELELNGKKVGEQYFAPGFTSYKHILQYDLYDVTALLKEQNELVAVVGGGWAVGRFTYSSKSRITCDRQAFLAELFLEYEDGSKEKIVTDESWQQTMDGNFRFGDFYDGEVYDATLDLNQAKWRAADIYRPKIKPQITARYGCPVTAHERLTPLSHFPAKNGKEEIYDFGQNFAGVVSLKIKGKAGQKVIVRHAEILTDGDLNVKSLRTAKATIVYICHEGEQEYSPRLTYMGFRYIAISGIAPENVEVCALALYSDFDETGNFECSDALLNKLQSNIIWSGKSNFVDIPTDCPQRDERMGWTGDISVFARTACFDFDLSAFLEKWLSDVRAEQGRGGGLPLVVPKQGISAPTVATACWADCIVLVPWAEYLARGDKELLRAMYAAMKKYLKAVRFWASLSGPGKYRRHIWKWLFQFGDWCAQEGGIFDWMKRGKWIATAYYANSCRIVSKIADILEKKKDVAYYAGLSEKIAASFRHVFTDGKGKLKSEFQTGYVLPLAFGLAEGAEREVMAQNLDRLVREREYHLSTGFTGTPHILFALADGGKAETAYKLLLQDTAPSWLACVKEGSTTTWEEWTIDPQKEGNIPSYNHYAYGAVGDFLYCRVAGIEPTEGGYKCFSVRPVLGGGLTYAKASVKTPYGTAASEWHLDGGKFSLKVTVPVSCTCRVTMPSGKQMTLKSGEYEMEEAV